MKLFVTGSDGYVGSVLCPLLMEHGHDVTGFDAGFYRDGLLYRERRRGPRTLNGDLRDLRAADLRGYDAVVHLAGLPVDATDPAAARVAVQLNHRNAVALAGAARTAGVARFVQPSSCDVYGPAAEPAGELSVPSPRDAQAQGMLAIERDLLALADARFAPVVLRLATAFGCSPHIRFDSIFNRLAGQAHTSGRIAVACEGTPWLPLVHVEDVAEAIRVALLAPSEAVRGQVLNVGDDALHHRLGDVARMMADAFPGSSLALGREGAEPRAGRVSFARIRRQLPAFRCRWSAERGARQLARSFAQIGLTAERFAAPAFTRSACLAELVHRGELDAEFRWTLPRSRAVG